MSDTPAEQTVTLTIDGVEITVPKGTLIIRAAEQLGTIVPRFCDHPLLDPVGACRQCIVDVEGQRKPMTACTTECGDGWVVKTHLTSEVAAQAQEGILEFLLINHPLDCPMCDKGGECPLQDQALTHGSNESRFVDEKRRYAKPVAVSPQVLLDRERCVLCARCTRFSNEISGDPFIELFERGALEQVAIYEDEPYASYFSGNVIQICPVGALTSASYRFKARPFDLRSAPSVCDGCSAGCTLTVQSRKGEVQRQLARTNMAVNEAWNCDKGRFGFSHLTSDRRLAEPAVRKAGELVGVSWAEALTTVTTAIAEAQAKGPGRVAVITGSRLADEDAYAVAKYTRAVLKTDDLDSRTHAPGPDEDAALAAVLSRPSATYADVENAPVILVVGLDAEEEVPMLHLRLRKAWRNHKAHIVPVGARMGSLAPYAWRRLATDPGAEAHALAALARGFGVASLAELAAESHYAEGHPELDAVTQALREAGSSAVILVGERAASSPGALAAATKLADATGAKLAWVPRRGGARGAFANGLVAGFLPGGRRLDDSTDRSEVAAVWGDLPTTPGRDVHAILTAAAAGSIDVLHLIGVDIARDFDAPALAAAALAKVGTVVVQDLTLNATTDHASVVLPATASQERDGTRTNWEGRAQRFQQAVAAPELAQHDWEITVQLSALLGADLGFQDLAGIRHEMAALGQRAEARRDVPTPATPTATDGDGLLLDTLPLLLDRGTMTADAVDLLATARTPFVAINETDARRLGIADGGHVTITSPHGKLTLPARVEADVVAGVVVVPRNSTDQPATTLSGRDGGRVRVQLAAANVPDTVTTPQSAEVPA